MFLSDSCECTNPSVPSQRHRRRRCQGASTQGEAAMRRAQGFRSASTAEKNEPCAQSCAHTMEAPPPPGTKGSLAAAQHRFPATADGRGRPGSLRRPPWQSATARGSRPARPGRALRRRGRARRARLRADRSPRTPRVARSCSCAAPAPPPARAPREPGPWQPGSHDPFGQPARSAQGRSPRGDPHGEPRALAAAHGLGSVLQQPRLRRRRVRAAPAGAPGGTRRVQLVRGEGRGVSS